MLSSTNQPKPTRPPLEIRFFVSVARGKIGVAASERVCVCAAQHTTLSLQRSMRSMRMAHDDLSLQMQIEAFDPTRAHPHPIRMPKLGMRHSNGALQSQLNLNIHILTNGHAHEFIESMANGGSCGRHLPQQKHIGHAFGKPIHVCVPNTF